MFNLFSIRSLQVESLIKQNKIQKKEHNTKININIKIKIKIKLRIALTNVLASLRAFRVTHSIPVCQK